MRGGRFPGLTPFKVIEYFRAESATYAPCSGRSSRGPRNFLDISARSPKVNFPEPDPEERDGEWAAAAP